MPQPEELLANTPDAREKAKAERHRPGFEDVVWFKIGVGRRQNAEPRWLLPLICRRGHITRNEIGAIRVGQHESWVQIPRNIAPKFADALKRTADGDDDQDAILIEESAEGPRIEARENRKHGGPDARAKPFRKGPGGGKPRAPFKRDNKDGPKPDRKPAGKKLSAILCVASSKPEAPGACPISVKRRLSMLTPLFRNCKNLTLFD